MTPLIRAERVAKRIAKAGAEITSLYAIDAICTEIEKAVAEIGAPELPSNTREYLRDLATRVEYFDRIALNVLADDQLSKFPQASS